MRGILIHTGPISICYSVKELFVALSFVSVITQFKRFSIFPRMANYITRWIYSKLNTLKEQHAHMLHNMAANNPTYSALRLMFIIITGTLHLDGVTIII